SGDVHPLPHVGGGVLRLVAHLSPSRWGFDLRPEIAERVQYVAHGPGDGRVAAGCSRGVRHATPPKSSTHCDSRCAAISQYRSSISIPIARRPRCFAAIKTLPEPVNGSTTETPGRVLALTSSAIYGTGFGVGCPFSAAIGKRQTGAAQCRLNTAPLWRANAHNSIADNQRCSPFIGDGFVFHQTPVRVVMPSRWKARSQRSEEHTSELQSRENLVCRLLLEKKKAQ